MAHLFTKTRPLKALAFLIVMILMARAGAAQEQTGSIQGSIRDIQGGLLPGVVVLATAASGLTVEAASDGTGQYRLNGLPPGAYGVVAKLNGFVPARVEGVDLALGVRLTIDLALSPEGPNEVVEVVSAPPRLAIGQSMRATTVSGVLIEQMPHGRDFTSLALQAPGAADERKLAGISVDGASAAENRIVIDGVETTDTWVGTPGQRVVTDFVEQVQIKSSGYSAEYGGSTGAVVNAISRSGGNRWRGQGLLYWSGSALEAGPVPTLRLRPDDPVVAEYVTYPEDRYDQLEIGGTLGGPLVAGRLWIFGGYLPAVRTTERTVTFRANQSTGTFDQDLTRQSAVVNLSTQLSPRWRGRVSFVSGWERQHNVLPAQDGTSNPAADFTLDDITPSYSTSASADYTPAGWAYLSIRGGYFARDSRNEGVYQGDRAVYASSSVGMAGVPPQYQQPRAYANVTSNVSRDRARGPRLGVQMDGTVSLSAAGSHELKGGVQFDRLGLDSLSGATGNSLIFFWGLALAGARGPYGSYAVNANTRLPNRGFMLQGKATVTNVGVFVQDAWRIGRRLTVHAGVRTETETVPSLSPDPAIPPVAIAFSFADKLAPRLGFAWDATGDGRTKVYGSWGVFYDITKLQLSFGFGGVDQQVTYFSLDSGDIGPIIDNPSCPPACPGAVLRGPISATTPLNSPTDNRIDPDVQQMRMKEFVVGLEREVAPALVLSARFIHKGVDRALEDVGTRSSSTGPNEVWIATPGQGKVARFFPLDSPTAVPLPRARRDYDAIEMSVQRQFTGRWGGGAAYTWSRLSGNYSGLAQSDEDGRVEPNVGVVFDTPLRSFDERGAPVEGVLATDRPHQFKLHGLASLPFRTSAGARWTATSGAPITREIMLTPGNPVMYRGRKSDGRLPFISQCNLFVRHEVRSRGRTTFAVGLNVANLFNQATANSYFAGELFPGQTVTVSEAQYMGGVDLQALIAPQGLVRDARFLMKSAFQPPQSARLSLTVGF